MNRKQQDSQNLTPDKTAPLLKSIVQVMWRKNNTDKCPHLASQLYHFFSYSIKRPMMQLEKAIFIISIDVDVGARELGVINRGRNDTNVNKRMSECRVGEIEEMAFPLFAERFRELEVPVTLAIRGQLAELNHSILDLEPLTKHDVAAHGYYHREFTRLSRGEAENELNLISSGLRRFGIVPRSFVFPKNSIAHLELLEKHGYKCYRGYSGFINDCMYIEKKGELYDVHPSLYLDRGCFTFPKKILDIAIEKRLPFHLWFHLWNLGRTKESIKRSIDTLVHPLLMYAKKKEESGILAFETMLSASEKVAVA